MNYLRRADRHESADRPAFLGRARVRRVHPKETSDSTSFQIAIAIGCTASDPLPCNTLLNKTLKAIKQSSGRQKVSLTCVRGLHSVRPRFSRRQRYGLTRP